MQCKKCNADKEEKSFATFKARDGTTRRRGVCWACRGQYAQDNFDRLQEWRREYNQKNRSKKQERDALRREEAKRYVDELKATTPCADCGKHFPPVCMDFDHVHGGKVKNVSRLVGGSYRLDLIIDEIKKCEIVCACCHRLRTAARGENLAPNKTALSFHERPPISTS